MDRILRVTASVLLLLASRCVIGQSQAPENSGSGTATPATSTGAFRVGGAVSAPRAIYAPDPEYSEEARQDRIEGVCRLWLVVGPDGKPRDIRVQRVIGHGLDEKAIEAVRQWKFQPALKDGKPVAVQINVEVAFHLYASGDQKSIRTESKIAELEKQARYGDAKAKLKLADVFFHGSGVTQNDNNGYRLLKEAANQGLPEAQFKMGEYIFSHGNQPGDYIAAYVWYEIAQRSGYGHSDKRLKEVAAKMSAENITEAKHQAENWKPSQ
jgi:TonB family protein